METEWYFSSEFDSIIAYFTTTEFNTYMKSEIKTWFDYMNMVVFKDYTNNNYKSPPIESTHLCMNLVAKLYDLSNERAFWFYKTLIAGLWFYMPNDDFKAALDFVFWKQNCPIIRELAKGIITVDFPDSLDKQLLLITMHDMEFRNVNCRDLLMRLSDCANGVNFSNRS